MPMRGATSSALATLTTMTKLARECRRCGYDLTGLIALRCPECGATVDPTGERRRSAYGRQVRFVVIAVASMTVGYVIVIGASIWQAERGYARLCSCRAANATRAQVADQIGLFWSRTISASDIPIAWRPQTLRADLTIVEYRTFIPLSSIYCIYDASGTLQMVIP